MGLGEIPYGHASEWLESMPTHPLNSGERDVGVLTNRLDAGMLVHTYAVRKYGGR